MNRELSGLEIAVSVVLLPVLIYFQEEVKWILLGIAVIGFPLSSVFYLLGRYLQLRR